MSFKGIETKGGLSLEDWHQKGASIKTTVDYFTRRIGHYFLPFWQEFSKGLTEDWWEVG